MNMEINHSNDTGRFARTLGGDVPSMGQQIKCGSSLSIRQEIQRFESVHPSIYAVYDLLELIPDPLISQQIREQVVCIEDSFVNSQEWTLSRAVLDLRVGIVGHVLSGKSALVHHYLTGTFVQDESPEGGRFKKEVNIDGQNYLLLIRDEGVGPEVQFSNWVDAVVLVFSLHHEQSFEAIKTYVNRIRHFRHSKIPPFVLVGTSADSTSKQHVVQKNRIERLCQELNNCSYFEASTSLGLRVDLVFQEACRKIIQSRDLGFQESKPITVSNQRIDSVELRDSSRPARNANSVKPEVPPRTIPPPSAFKNSDFSDSSANQKENVTKKWTSSVSSSDGAACSSVSKEISAAESTPTSARKAKRKSNIFTIGHKNKALEEKNRNGELGIGRTIPVQQGYLHKKSSKALNKDWKKKYVTITSDGVLTYHPTLHDYMNNVHGKDIPLKHTTVKVRGNRFRIPKPADNTPDLSSLQLSSDLEDKSKDKSSRESGKKKHRRVKSNLGELEECDLPEFTVVSLSNKEWRFEAETLSERDTWVEAIQLQILNCLQGMESDKTKMNSENVNESAVAEIRAVRGNQNCADCDAPNPGWACINLGTLICIECSGIHRNLGSHISKVRSLDLDDWPSCIVNVMMSIGNTLANRVWEALADSKLKPKPLSNHDEKNAWIRMKYEEKKFVVSSPESTIYNQLLSACAKGDLFTIYSILASKSAHNVLNGINKNGKCGMKTPLHIAAGRGDVAIVQLLIWAGFDCMAVDSDGLNPLKIAVMNGRQEVVKLLKAQGCVDDPNSRSFRSLTPSLEFALTSQPASDI